MALLFGGLLFDFAFFDFGGELFGFYGSGDFGFYFFKVF